MGGRGSGRHCQPGAKATTADYRALDVRWLQREGVLAARRRFGCNWRHNEHVLASISVRAEATRLVLSYGYCDHLVQLDWTRCNYGGQRAWFLCPTAGCARRVAVLYFRRAEAFACRHCHRLAYRCQREAADERATRRANRIRARLGWPPGILNGDCDKPKRMREETFVQLSLAYWHFAERSLAGMERRVRSWLT